MKSIVPLLKDSCNLPSGDIFWFVALQTVNIENGSQTASVGPGCSFNAHVELSAVSGVSVSAVQSRLVNVGWVRADESFSDFCKSDVRRK
ncbi:hypothetical protein CDAR_505201 [Caerostris darwini]|uniref:Uncharacterized protein n=1 Tax=Caerostris darwini TaxID=1538125 RepID=A0AAV4QXI9_9ARAC|nr:hypothetical protein CDAR_505201 [Caerostris darwini]